MTCYAYQQGRHMVCGRCDIRWNLHDPMDRPRCVNPSVPIQPPCECGAVHEAVEADPTEETGCHERPPRT